MHYIYLFCELLLWKSKFPEYAAHNHYFKNSFYMIYLFVFILYDICYILMLMFLSSL